MKIGAVMKEIMREKGITQSMMGESLGIKQQTVQDRISHTNISLNKVIEMMGVLGYEVVVQPVAKGRRNDDQKVITRGDK